MTTENQAPEGALAPLPEGHHCKAWGACTFCQECGADLTPKNIGLPPPDNQPAPAAVTSEMVEAVRLYLDIRAGEDVPIDIEAMLRAALAAQPRNSLIEALQARITSLSREAWEWSKALEAQLKAAPAQAPAEGDATRYLIDAAQFTVMPWDATPWMIAAGESVVMNGGKLADAYRAMLGAGPLHPAVMADSPFIVGGPQLDVQPKGTAAQFQCQGRLGGIACTDHCGRPECVWAGQAPAPGAAGVVTDAMVDRFLGWRLPDDFSPDGGVTFKPLQYGTVTTWPSGTNLLNAIQARAMLEFVHANPPQAMTREWCADFPGSAAGIINRLAQRIDELEAAVKPSPAVGAPNLLLEWACMRWREEVANRPLVNVHRRSLDDVWRQVVRFAGGDPAALLGSAHDELVGGAK